MSKVTSKLQVTVPKALVERYGIRPGETSASRGRARSFAWRPPVRAFRERGSMSKPAFVCSTPRHASRISANARRPWAAALRPMSGSPSGDRLPNRLICSWRFSQMRRTGCWPVPRALLEATLPVAREHFALGYRPVPQPAAARILLAAAVMEAARPEAGSGCPP